MNKQDLLNLLQAAQENPDTDAQDEQIISAIADSWHRTGHLSDVEINFLKSS